MDIDGAAVAVVLEAPDLIQQLIAGEYAVGVAGQVEQELQLLGRGIHDLAIHLELVAGHIDGELIVADLLDLTFGGAGGAAAAQHGLDAGHDLLGIEGLDNIVIGAQLQAQHLIEGFALGGEHDDGAIALLADLPANLPAIQLGHHDIQEDKRGLFALELGHGFFAIVGHYHLEALLFQVQAQQLADIQVVIGYQDLVHHCYFLLTGHSILIYIIAPAGSFA